MSSLFYSLYYMAESPGYAYYVLAGLLKSQKEGDRMEYGIVVYSSITVANRAIKLAKGHISHTKIMQIPAELGIKGCSYSVKCPRNELDALLELSREHSLKIKAVFIEKTKGSEREYERL